MPNPTKGHQCNYRPFYALCDNKRPPLLVVKVTSREGPARYHDRKLVLCSIRWQKVCTPLCGLPQRVFRQLPGLYMLQNGQDIFHSTFFLQQSGLPPHAPTSRGRASQEKVLFVPICFAHAEYKVTRFLSLKYIMPLQRIFTAHFGERRTISESYWNFCSICSHY